MLLQDALGILSTVTIVMLRFVEGSHPVSGKIVIEPPSLRWLEGFDLSCATVLNYFLHIAVNMQRLATLLSAAC